MPLEIGDFISDLVITNPLGTDPKSEGDDHLRLLKKTVQQTFPNIIGEMSLTQEQLNGFIGNLANFTGMIAGFPAVAVDDSWLLCDGQAVLRDTYPELFAFIGLTYGAGDGLTDFILPNYSGQFLRGTDNGAGIDPDAATRTDRGDGVEGDVIGSKQAFEIQSHLHTLPSYNATAHQAGTFNAPHGLVNSTANSNSTGGNETRPVNINVNYYIHV